MAAEMVAKMAAMMIAMMIAKVAANSGYCKNYLQLRKLQKNCGIVMFFIIFSSMWILM